MPGFLSRWVEWFRAKPTETRALIIIIALVVAVVASPDAEDEAEEAEGHRSKHEEQDHPQRVRDLERHEQARRGQDEQAQDDRLGRGCADVANDDLDVGNGSRQ